MLPGRRICEFVEHSDVLIVLTFAGKSRLSRKRNWSSKRRLVPSSDEAHERKELRYASDVCLFKNVLPHR
jgi:hypothetical protein